jgi:hypothetical protein
MNASILSDKMLQKNSNNMQINDLRTYEEKQFIDDQIWQVWKNRIIRFLIVDYPVLAVF